LRVLVLTTFDLDDYVYGALRAGASGFLLKDAPPEELIRAIHVVAGGESLLAPTVTRRLITEFAARPDTATPSPALSGLTDREHEVLLLIARGTLQPGDRRAADSQRDHHQDTRRAGADEAGTARQGAGGRAGIRTGADSPPAGSPADSG